ncbi:MAG TPA: TerC family protein [Phycisphaerae bacterium]|nr:TerC family protein [Phycisphaerae bacterium]HRY68789.1 TerC family protein [Phycisphaerae bacterium]HSA27452.1 TerC family protein [Phycisphaerae bacterium]
MAIWLWIGFVLFVLVMLALDLGVLNRKAHTIGTWEALRWASLCAFLALAFNVAVYFIYQHNWLGMAEHNGVITTGRQAALDFFTGYIVEQSLSMDNIFVIALIFNYFGVPAVHQHRVLFWGIMGALVMRGVMILAGAALISRFHWIIYVFGVLLLATAVKMMFAGEEKVEPDRNILVRLARRLYPVTKKMEGQRFFTHLDGKRAITPMFVCLLVIESTDVLFAIDSIPAIFAITRDPFIVFTSNIFAILCLRSLYFALAGLMHKFRYLKSSLVFLLAYIGVKMLLTDLYEIPTGASLAIIGGALVVGIAASLLSEQRPAPLPAGHEDSNDPGTNV